MGLVNVMYPDPRSNSSERDSVDITVALIASTRDAEATNGLRIAFDASDAGFRRR